MRLAAGQFHPVKIIEVNMTDSSDNTVSKTDLEVLIATFDQKLQAREEKLLKEFDVRENKIHSSYAKKMKQFAPASDPSDEDVEVSPDKTVARKPTKREMELQDSVEKLIKRSEDAEKKALAAAQKNQFSEHLLKNGFAPEALDTVYTLQTAKEAFSQDELGNFQMKVNVDGANVVLPIEKAASYFAKSAEAKFFLAPKGVAGSGGKSPAETPSNNGKPKERVVVDWNAAAHDMGFKG